MPESTAPPVPGVERLPAVHAMDAGSALPRYMLVTPPAEVSMKALFEMVESSAAQHRGQSNLRILVDARHLPLGPGAHAVLSHHVGQNFNALPGVRIAVLVNERSPEGQLIARQQGTDLRLFETDEEEFAKEWLSEP